MIDVLVGEGGGGGESRVGEREREREIFVPLSILFFT